MKKNIVYIIADQLRYDFINTNGNDYIDTPNLNMMANAGYNFTNCYTAVSSCISARAAIHTGLSQKSHKRVGYEDGISWDYENMLAEVFARNGYHTQCIGKMHVYPTRKLCGFHNVILHDGYLHESRRQSNIYKEQYDRADDYLYWLKDEFGVKADLTDFGISCNSWDQRNFSLPEYAHPTNWVTTEAIDFLRRRDPEKPFFLNISYVAPHSPLTPPEYYFEKYKDKETLPVVKSDWDFYNQRAYDIDAKFGDVGSENIKKARRAYSGLVEQIDHQVGRFLLKLGEYGLLENTIIVFGSDHGDMLGDHNFLRKSVPYQASIHIPLIVYDPGNNLGENKARNFDQIIELRDIMPSLLDFCGIEIPNTVEGKSVKKLIDGENLDLRDYLHGEHVYANLSNHYIMDKYYKYIWYSQSGVEQFFDLMNDPTETRNLIDDKNLQDKISYFRENLIKELEDRQEGFVKNGKLQVGCELVNTLD